MSLLDTAREGDRLATMRALRDRLAAELDGCESARDVAALSARLTDALSQIAGIEAATEKPKGSTVDALAARRAARRTAGA